MHKLESMLSSDQWADHNSGFQTHRDVLLASTLPTCSIAPYIHTTHMYTDSLGCLRVRMCVCMSVYMRVYVCVYTSYVFERAAEKLTSVLVHTT